MRHSYWLTSGFYTLMEKGMSLMFGFGGAIFLFRLLPLEEFGIWALFLSITSVMEVGRIGLLQNALVKYLSTHSEEETGAIITASFVLNGLLTGLMVLLLLTLAPWAAQWFNASVLEKLLKIYCLTTVVLIPFFQGNYIQQARLDFKGIFWGNFVRGGILFGYIGVVFIRKSSLNLESLALVQATAAFFASLTVWYFARKFVKFNRQVEARWIFRLFDYGKFVLGTNLSTQLFKNTEKILLGLLPGGGAAAVALYDAAMRVTNLTDIPTASMATILFPQSARRMKEGNGTVKMLYEKAVGAILAFMVPCVIFVLLFAEWIIHLVAGSAYSEAAGILRITILFGLFMPYAVQFGTVLDSTGKPKVNFIFTVGSLILTGLLNYLIIPAYGVYGAACATLIAYAITFVFMQYYLHKHLNIQAWASLGYMFEFYKQSLQLLESSSERLKKELQGKL